MQPCLSPGSPSYLTAGTDSGLSIHTSTWKSGLDDEELTLSLIVAEASKLGVSQSPGKKPRLIGDVMAPCQVPMPLAGS